MTGPTRRFFRDVEWNVNPGQEFMGMWVKHTGSGINYWMEIIVDEITREKSYLIYDYPGGVLVGISGPFEPISSSGALGTNVMYERDIFYFTGGGGSGAFPIGTRLYRLRFYDSTAALVTTAWEEEDGTTINPVTFNYTDLISDNDVMQIDEEYIKVVENSGQAGGYYQFQNIPSGDLAFAKVQVKGHQTMINDAYISGSLTAAMQLNDLVRYQYSLGSPGTPSLAANEGYSLANGDEIIVPADHIGMFRCLAKTDYVLYGSDIRPLLYITYWIGKRPY